MSGAPRVPERKADAAAWGGPSTQAGLWHRRRGRERPGSWCPQARPCPDQPFPVRVPWMSSWPHALLCDNRYKKANAFPTPSAVGTVRACPAPTPQVWAGGGVRRALWRRPRIPGDCMRSWNCLGTILHRGCVCVRGLNTNIPGFSSYCGPVHPGQPHSTPADE
uniref:Uncharacterized protein n=1 Tax=Molossus molossus TaxID=27622 RepID=A0A7J8HHZ7_MOLMO|nr:hypothetical protein HJG59_010918 [Molossus molossus]